MLGFEHRLHRADRRDLAVGKSGDAVANSAKAVEIVRDHKDGNAQRLMKSANQRVKLAGRDRIKSRRRLIEKNDLRIERQGAREPHALGHPSR